MCVSGGGGLTLDPGLVDVVQQGAQLLALRVAHVAPARGWGGVLGVGESVCVRACVRACVNARACACACACVLQGGGGRNSIPHHSPGHPTCLWACRLPPPSQLPLRCTLAAGPRRFCTCPAASPEAPRPPGRVGWGLKTGAKEASVERVTLGGASAHFSDHCLVQHTVPVEQVGRPSREQRLHATRTHGPPTMRAPLPPTPPPPRPPCPAPPAGRCPPR